MKLKNNKGFTGIDIAIATIIFIVFISIITNLFYNLSTTAKKIERKTIATNLCINIIETIKQTDFDKLTSTDDVEMNIDTLETLSGKTIEIPDGYTPEIIIEDYNNENVIKILNVTISYKQNKNTEKITIETLVKNI